LLIELASHTIRATFAGHRGNIDRLAFSPDSCILASAGLEPTILLWDLSGRLLREQAPQELNANDLERVWQALADKPGKAAFQERIQLAARPKQAVALIKERLKPAPAIKVDPQQLDAWMRDLDSDKFAVREKAHKELAKLGFAAEEAVRKALAG